MSDGGGSRSRAELPPRAMYASSWAADSALHSMAVALACDWNFRGGAPGVQYIVVQRPQRDGWLVMKDFEVAAELWFDAEPFEHSVVLRGRVHDGAIEQADGPYFSALMAQAVLDARSLDDPDSWENSYDRGRWVQASRRFRGTHSDVMAAAQVLADTTLAQDAATNEQKPPDLQHAERCLIRPASNLIQIIYESARVPLMSFAVDGTRMTISQVVFSQECAEGTELQLERLLSRAEPLVAAIARQRQDAGPDLR